MSVTLVTLDEIKLSRRISSLKRRFNYFANIFSIDPEAGEIPVNATENQWYLLETFVKFLETPTTSRDWILLIEIANYLDLNPHYTRLLEKTAFKFLGTRINFLLPKAYPRGSRAPWYTLEKLLVYMHCFEFNRTCPGENGKCKAILDPGEDYCIRCCIFGD